MAADSASACGGRSDFSTPAGEIRCSQRTESVLPSRATWNRSKRGCGLSCLRGRRISRTGSIPDTAVFLPSMSIISICWARSKSGSIRPA